MPKVSAKKIERLQALVYYAVDKASPYSLAYSVTTNTLDKVLRFTLAELAMTPQGASIMWLWINAHCQPDAKPVATDIAVRCVTVDDVYKAVLANIL